MAGVESTQSPVEKVHFADPSELIAWSLLSFDPIYIVPSVPIAGDEKIVPPVEYGVAQWIVGFPDPTEIKNKVAKRGMKDLR
jgi:hypothetical protein